MRGTEWGCSAVAAALFLPLSLPLYLASDLDMTLLTAGALQQAGFILQTELPSGTGYTGGDLFMRLDHNGTVRVFLSNDSDQVEISSGSIYEPQVHYTGPVLDVAQLLRFIEGYVL
jgi:hypothetical protein